ncbi:MAG: hypothetical protein WED00_11180 [Aquisalimonadaceae bacterium]
MKGNESVLEEWLNAKDPLDRPTELQLQRWARAQARRELFQACKRLISGLVRKSA